jgi:hypothetical protein
MILEKTTRKSFRIFLEFADKRIFCYVEGNVCYENGDHTIETGWSFKKILFILLIQIIYIKRRTNDEVMASGWNMFIVLLFSQVGTFQNEMTYNVTRKIEAQIND